MHETHGTSIALALNHAVISVMFTEKKIPWKVMDERSSWRKVEDRRMTK